MRDRAADVADVGLAHPVERAVEPAEHDVAALVIVRLQDRRAQRRREAEREERREQHRHRDRDRELLVDRAGRAGLQRARHEHRREHDA